MYETVELPSVCPVDCQQQLRRRVYCWVPCACGQEILIDSRRQHSAAMELLAVQHGTQQQMQAVSRLEPTEGWLVMCWYLQYELVSVFNACIFVATALMTLFQRRRFPPGPWVRLLLRCVGSNPLKDLIKFCEGEKLLTKWKLTTSRISELNYVRMRWQPMLSPDHLVLPS